jgi:Arc/MetJ-type ribon-helix-helix transcriptional regulator
MACIPNWYRFGMTTQIALRLPDAVVEFVDAQVSIGAAKSRADFVGRAIRREQRRIAAEHDAEIYAQFGEDPELRGLAEYSAQLPRPELD